METDGYGVTVESQSQTFVIACYCVHKRMVTTTDPPVGRKDVKELLLEGENAD